MKTIQSNVPSIGHNCTDAELRAAVALAHGWKRKPSYIGDYQWVNEAGHGAWLPPFATSVDAVLPLLEDRAMVVEISYCSIGCTWSVTITGHKTQWRHPGASNECLARVICFALLKAHGFTVVDAAGNGREA